MKIAPTPCGAPCDVYSRIVGYFSPVSRWNKGKQEEFRERKNFDINNQQEKKPMQKIKINKTFTATWSNSIGGKVVTTERTFTEGEFYRISSQRPEGWMVYYRSIDIDGTEFLPAEPSFLLFSKYIKDFCELIP